jgi:hypothetical protein
MRAQGRIAEAQKRIQLQTRAMAEEQAAQEEERRQREEEEREEREWEEWEQQQQQREKREQEREDRDRSSPCDGRTADRHRGRCRWQLA